MASVFTQAGEEFIVDIIDGTLAVPANYYMGWGTGAGTAAKGDTTLFTEAAEARVAVTKTQPVVDKNRFVATIVATGTKTITNGGVLTASSGGTLVLHWDHSGIGVVSGDSITYTVDWEQT